MKEIVDVHYPDLEDKLLQSAMRVFYEIRDLNGIKKRPSTSELIDWIKLLVLGKITSEELDDIDVDNELPPYVGSLLKNEQDHGLIRLVKRRFR